MSETSDKGSRRSSVASKHSESSSKFSRASFAPTVNGGETPFEEFAWSVQQLCKKFWPSAYEEVTITRLDGGSFNRIVGLSVKPSLALTPEAIPALPETSNSEDRSEHYILRISRDDDSDIADHIMTLFYLRTHTNLPVPRVLAFDVGSDNVLESSYTLQQRMPGIPLNTIIKKLSFGQRRGLAIQIAQIIRQMQDVKSPVAGRIGIITHIQPVTSGESSDKTPGIEAVELSLEKKLAFLTMTGLPSDTSEASTAFEQAEAKMDSTHTLQVLHFDLNTNFDGGDHFNGTACTVKRDNYPVLSFFNFQFVRQMLKTLQTSPNGALITGIYRKLMQVALEMEEDDCLGRQVFNLFHGDLEPRNLLVHICNFGEVHIAGILDWDNSAFVPGPVSCIAPRWIWSIKEELDSSERDDEDDPTDPEQKALKEAFDNAIGEDFVKMAYSPEYRLVRRLFRVSIGGINTNEDFSECENIPKEWDELRSKSKDSDSDDDVSEDDHSNVSEGDHPTEGDHPNGDAPTTS